MGAVAFARRTYHRLLRSTSRALFYHPVVVRSKLRYRFSSSDGVTKSFDGSCHHGTGRYAVFILWQPEQTPWYVWNVLNALRDATANLLLVVNHELSEERIDELRPFVAHFIFRDNRGMDMGGYKDASAFLAAKGAVTSRVAYLNDSVYYFRDGLAEVISRLFESAADICAAFENWEFQYHLQSFCLSFSPSLFNGAALQKFWRDYLPINSRIWAINKGEIGLSRVALQNARSTEVLFPIANLTTELSTLPPQDLTALARYLPLDLRPTPDEVARLPSAATANLFGNRASMRSTIHTAGFLFMRFAKNPMMKRDLVFRLQFDAHEVEHLLREFGRTSDLSAILTDIRRKGSGRQLPPVEWLKFTSGAK